MKSRKIEKIGSGDQLHLWMMFEGNGTYIRVVVEMAEPVDGTVLKDAVESNLKVFPNMKKRLVIHRNKYFYVENYEKAPVFEQSGKGRAFCTDDTNGYSFYVAYEENKIHFTFMHHLADGIGLQLFASYVIRTYLRDRYKGEYEFDAAEEMKRSPFEDIVEPIDRIDKEKRTKTKAEYKLNKKAFSITGTSRKQDDTRLLISMSEDRVVELAHELGVTPTAVAISVFNIAIKNTYKPENEELVSTVLADLRRRTGIYPLRNFYSMMFVSVNSDDIDIDPAEECRAGGRRIDAVSETAVANIKDTTDVVKLFLMIPGSVKRRISTVKKLIGKATEGVATYHLSYVRGIKQSEWYRSKVLGMTYEVFPAASSEPYIVIYSRNGLMRWEIIFLPDRDKLGSEISKVLGELGIECETTEYKADFKDSFDIDRVEII